MEPYKRDPNRPPPDFSKPFNAKDPNHHPEDPRNPRPPAIGLPYPVPKSAEICLIPTPNYKPGKVILAQTIAKDLLAEVASGLEELEFKPKLVGFLANDDMGAKVYAEFSAKTCVQNGFMFEVRVVRKQDIEEAILAANEDKKVHGIIVYYPIFPRESRQDQYLQQLVALDKDVEGLSHKYLFNMYQNNRFLDPPENKQKSILPCTPLAVIKVLEHLHIYNPALPYGNRLFGKTITVINRSEVVGRPLAALLANDGALVYSCDINGVQLFSRGKGIENRKHEVHDQTGWTINHVLPMSDVIVSGVPGDEYKVPSDLIKYGATCINFSSEKNFITKDPYDVKKWCAFYVPAIGKVTIAVLLRNLLRLVQNREEEKLKRIREEEAEKLKLAEARKSSFSN